MQLTPLNSVGTSPNVRPSAPAPDALVDPYDPAVVRERLEAARRAEMSEDQPTDDLVGSRAPSYFRSYEQLKAAMYELQAKYPDLVTVRDIGDSAEKAAGKADRDLLAIELTAKGAGSASRPMAFHMAGIHAREIANPEMLMAYATKLLEGYGVDPEATATLNTRRVVLLPITNPDGHAVVEKGYTGEPGGALMQRKSTSAGDPRKGVDLNRNFDFHWGTAGSSSNENSDIYHGKSAASEVETQAIQDFIKAEKPQVFIDWHSYSKLNLFPWGDTKAPTKDHEAFQALARKFTTFNRYTPVQSIGLYPTSGTTIDYAYATVGAAALTVETGSSFHQSDVEFQKTMDENMPVLAYATKVADAPFQRVWGPDATGVTIDPVTRQLTAALSDASNGRDLLSGAEIVLDPNAAPGTGIALKAADGSFDSMDERVVGDTSAISGGAGTLVYVRGRDAEGNWGALTPQWLVAPAISR